jgi:hypothetical protein
MKRQSLQSVKSSIIRRSHEHRGSARLVMLAPAILLGAGGRTMSNSHLAATRPMLVEKS